MEQTCPRCGGDNLTTYELADDYGFAYTYFQCKDCGFESEPVMAEPSEIDDED